MVGSRGQVTEASRPGEESSSSVHPSATRRASITQPENRGWGLVVPSPRGSFGSGVGLRTQWQSYGLYLLGGVGRTCHAEAIIWCFLCHPHSLLGQGPGPKASQGKWTPAN